jgi:hypothetical protein
MAPDNTCRAEQSLSFSLRQGRTRLWNEAPPACVFYSCSIGLIEVSDLLLLARERSRSEFLEVLDNNDDDYQK